MDSLKIYEAENIGEVGFNIPEVCRIVQERVKTAIENMTGLTVDTVDIKIANVNIDN